MSGLHPWKSGTSALLALSLLTGATTPFWTLKPATAQLFPQPGSPSFPRPGNRTLYSSEVTIPAGTIIPLQSEEEDKILVTKEETMPLTLTVAANIRDNRDRLLIPYGSEVIGEIRPAGGGSQFFAREIILPDRTQLFIDGDSRVVTRIEEVEEGADISTILQNAAIGAAAAGILSAILGDRAIATEEILGGAGLGALGGLIFGRKKAEFVSINPDADLDITLNSDVTVTTR